MAQEMVNAAVKKGKEIGVKVNIAIVDDGGHLVSFGRMDGAPLLSIEIATNKAFTAIAFGLPTHDWHPLIAEEPALREGIVHTPRLVIFGGGFPIKVGDQIIGGIGVSGGSAEQDMACAQAGLAVFAE
ncbi:MAG TPA: cobalamin adenosyltransferase [Paenibacillaceae bacterium]|nr:cobalamin adenosyltransferase [Paenibacillaceae bacterium]